MIKNFTTAKLFLLIIFLLPFLYLEGQENVNTDSLKKIIQVHLSPDTVRAFALIQYVSGIITHDLETAITYTQEALAISQKLNWRKGIAFSYRDLGATYQISNNNVEAIRFYEKAITADSGYNKFFEIGTLDNIATIYADIQQYDKALDYYQRDLQIVRELKKPDEETRLLGNIGRLYLLQEMNDSAARYYNESLKLAEKSNYNYGECASILGLAIIDKNMGKFDDALQKFNKVIKIANKENIGFFNVYINSEIAQIYTRTGKYNSGEVYALKAIKLAKESHLLETQVDSWKILDTVYERKGNHKKALVAYKNYILIRDSILNNDKKNKIASIEMQYQFSKTQDSVKTVIDKREAIAENEIQKQKLVKNATIAGAGFVILGGFGAFIFYKRNRNIRMQKNEAELQQQVSDTEMKALRSQMNPHFIFNSLNSISDYIKKNKISAADDFLVKFSQLIRAILENSEMKEVSLSVDLQALEIYMQLEAQRLDNKFSYEIVIDEAIDKDNTLIPPLILQPFVENSIWHGIADKQGNGKILIHIKKEGNMISCIVEDDGVGLQNETEEKRGKKSLGLKITRARIDILNKTKKANASLQLLRLQQGTRAEVKLPLQLSF